MIRVAGSTGSDGKTIIWFFIVCYTKNGYTMTPMHTQMNRKGAQTYFYKMIQREKKLDREKGGVMWLGTKQLPDLLS